MEKAAALSRSSPERSRLWQTLAELGALWLGSSDAGGFSAAVPIIRNLGAAHCPAPLLDVAVLNALCLVDGSLWAQKFRRTDVIPCIAPAWPGLRGLGDVRLTDRGLQGAANLTEAVGTSHMVALVTDETASNRALWAWVPLDQAGIEIVAQEAYGETSLRQVRFERASLFEVETNPRDPQDIASLWRLALAIRATGALERAFNLTIEYVKQRRQFGVPIGSFQAIQHKLADIRIALDGAKLTQEAAARSVDRARAHWRFEVEAAIAAADPALRRCMLEVHHAFGAIGYSEEHEATRHFRRIHIDLARADGEEARGKLFDSMAQLNTGHLLTSDLGKKAESFRREVRAWLGQHWNASRQQSEFARPLGDQGFDRGFSRELGATGWIALTWPERYGGQCRSRLEQLALIQETSRTHAPTRAHAAAASLVAPALIAFGSDQQKAEFLPRIARGELSICLGYSEPQAGSDLASLRTRAVRDGDDYLINGQKMWGTGTDKADYVWLAARTDPDAKKQAGISVFLIPMNTPGITIRPSLALYGKTFSAQFYDDVRAPASSLIGGVNQGWNVITGALADERILMGSLVTQMEVALANLVQFLDQRVASGEARKRLGGFIAEVRIANAMVVRCVELTESCLPCHVEAAISKTFSGELMERFAEAALDLAGPQAVLSRGAAAGLLHGDPERLLRAAPMQVIGGGANEIQRTLIAQRGLGLPR